MYILVIAAFNVDISSCSVGATLISVVSSANKGAVTCVSLGPLSTKSVILGRALTKSGRSLIKMRIRVGPNAKPWGTHQLTEVLLDKIPLNEHTAVYFEDNYEANLTLHPLVRKIHIFLMWIVGEMWTAWTSPPYACKVSAYFNLQKVLFILSFTIKQNE